MEQKGAKGKAAKGPKGKAAKAAAKAAAAAAAAAAAEAANADKEQLAYAEDQFRTEAALLATYRHQNIIRLLGFWFDAGRHSRHCLVYELMPGGSLMHRLKAPPPGSKALLEEAHRSAAIAAARATTPEGVAVALEEEFAYSYEDAMRQGSPGGGGMGGGGFLNAPLKTSECSKYAIGQYVEGLKKGEVTGVVVYVQADNGTQPPHHRGPGAIVVQRGTTRSLTAEERFSIASDVARGLEYLHVSAHPPIIHQDVKSANILLS